MRRLTCVVVVELQGLTKGESPQAKSAESALTWLQETLKEQKAKIGQQGQLRVQTSKGNYVYELNNVTEDWSDLGAANNDDVILRCCELNKISSKADKQSSAPVALLTDDTHLRLKARACGVVALKSVKSLISIK
jgi:predicted ribonuclease YlaK